MYALEEDTVYNNEYEYGPVLPLAQMDENSKREYWASLALRHCKGLGIRTQTKLLKYFGSAYSAMENKKTWPLAGVNSELCNEILKELWRQPAKKEWDAAKKTKASILLWTNKYYPRRLRELIDAPIILYCRGNIQLLEGPAVAVVGSRNATETGIKAARGFGRGLSEAGITVVSGMASGIDRWAHASALGQVGKSIGVLGTGIDIIYPLSNKDLYEQMTEEGLLISEFSPNNPPVSSHFPVRNRLISGLSVATLVVEAAERSGSLITARLALEQNRDIFAVPGSSFNHESKGCQNLIRQGARAVFSVENILEDIKDSLTPFKLVTIDSANKIEPEKKKPAKKQTRKTNCAAERFAKTKVEGEIPQKIIACLMENGAMHVDNLADTIEISINDINSNIILLEMQGLIKRLPGSKYDIA